MSRPEGGDYYTTNPPFDTRIRGIFLGAQDNPFADLGSTLFRGRIQSKDKVNGYYRQLNFLYNPSGIEWVGNVDTDTIGDSQVMDALDTSTFMMPMAQTVSFSLLFDRTYETWVYDQSKETSRLGVLSDIKALYAMLGIMGDSTAFTPGHNTTGAPIETEAGNTAKAAGLATSVDISMIEDPTPRSFMQYVQVIVMFGRDMTYHGVINNTTVTYTHFTQKMIPNRCSVQIGMQLFPYMPGGVAPAAAAPWTTGQGSVIHGTSGASQTLIPSSGGFSGDPFTGRGGR